MKIRAVPAAIESFITEFSKFYHESRVRTENLRAVKYRIITTLEEYKKSQKIQIALTDRPGEILPPMPIEYIKNEAPDIIAYMHPIDVNSINDLYYLSKDNIVEVKVSGDKVMAMAHDGSTIEYNVNNIIDVDKITSPRVSYLIGQMQAEKIMRSAYQENERYRIIRDNIATLHVADNKTDKESLKRPTDILFSGEYKFYSKEDVVKIGYICGQMSKIV